MAQMIGADVEALERLALQFEQSADRLRLKAGQVSSGVSASAWVGPVAVRFRAAWDSQHSVALKNAAEALAANATILRQNAADQRQASSAAGGSIGGGGAGGLGRVTSTPATFDDYLGLSGAAYEGGEPPPGWTEVDGDALEALGLTEDDLHNPETGLDADLFLDENGNYVLSFRGTTEWVGTDGWADLQGAIGLSDQGRGAVDIATRLQAAVGGENLSFTGHSLGGRNAALAAIATGGQAVTFNAAGVSDFDLAYANAAAGQPVDVFQAIGSAFRPPVVDPNAWVYSQDRADASQHVTNYTAPFDALTMVQVGTGMPDALGNQVYAGDINLNPIESHNLGGFEGSDGRIVPPPPASEQLDVRYLNDGIRWP